MGKVKENSYVTIQSWMRNELDLKGNDLLVYAMIYGFTQSGEVWYYGTRQYMANWAGATRQGIDKNLRNLVNKGLIEKSTMVINGETKVCYRATEFTGVTTQFTGGVNSVYRGCKQSLQVGCKLSLHNNNIDSDNTKYTIDNNSCEKSEEQQAEDLFEMLWLLYPKKRGKHGVSKKSKKELLKIGYSELAKAVERYKQETENQDPKYILNGSTFFNGRYLDYIDENYKPLPTRTEQIADVFKRAGEKINQEGEAYNDFPRI